MIWVFKGCGLITYIQSSIHPFGYSKGERINFTPFLTVEEKKEMLTESYLSSFLPLFSGVFSSGAMNVNVCKFGGVVEQIRLNI